MSINIIGAGLAGCEAAWQIANRNIEVNLYEMKPRKYTPAHGNKNFAELVCSNSFKSESADTASGLLKREMNHFGSLLLACAYECRVEAGGALAVDRDEFAKLVTARVRGHNLINVIEEEVTDIPRDGITVIATGPLTAGKLAHEIDKISPGQLSFFDAVAPIVTEESIDMNRAFFASRYGKGEETAYINCPLDRDEYECFHAELVRAKRVAVRDFDVQNPKVYEGCMPVEVMAQRGIDTLRFGPMKPVGLTDVRTGKRPYAVVQLRAENQQATLYNIVGFQTNLKFKEQKRVFSLIPGLSSAEFMRYGVMHRNTFIDSPRVLNIDFSMKSQPEVFFAGQITGVEGYMESAASGIIVGMNASYRYMGRQPMKLPVQTMMGALSLHISNEYSGNFQPMGANFGILPPMEPHIKDKKTRHEAFGERSMKKLEESFSKI